MMTSLKRVLNINKVIFRYHTKSFSDKVSSKLNDQVKSYSCPKFNTKTVPNDDVKFGSRIQKLFMFKFLYQNGKKRKKVGKKFSGLQNGAIRGLQIGAGLRVYKYGQEELLIGAA